MEAINPKPTHLEFKLCMRGTVNNQKEQAAKWKEAALHQKRLRLKYPKLDGASMTLLENIEDLQNQFRVFGDVNLLKTSYKCSKSLTLCDNCPYILLTSLVHPRRVKGANEAAEGCVLIPLWETGDHLTWTRLPPSAGLRVDSRYIFAAQKQGQPVTSQALARNLTEGEANVKTIQAAVGLKKMTDPMSLAVEVGAILDSLSRAKCTLNIFQEVHLQGYLGSQDYNTHPYVPRFPKGAIRRLTTELESQGPSGEELPDAGDSKLKKVTVPTRSPKKGNLKRARGDLGDDQSRENGGSQQKRVRINEEHLGPAHEENKLPKGKGPGSISTRSTRNKTPEKGNDQYAVKPTDRVVKPKARSRIAQKCVSCGTAADYEWRNQEGPERNQCQNRKCGKIRDKA